MDAIKPSPDSLRNLGLLWWPETGVGFHPDPPLDYDSNYFKMYQEYDKSALADAINKWRMKIFRGYAGEDHIDVGIGGGRFCTEAGCNGYDINPVARQWLASRGKYRMPQLVSPQSISLWDVLEHIVDPTHLINSVQKTIMVSIPIFRNCEHVLSSKHYKPGEHVWYFTHDGLCWFMRQFGFVLVMDDDRETQAGREDIHTFVFQREEGI